MTNGEQTCYIYIQLPGTTETVPCASLKVRAVAAGTFEGTFAYGKRYLDRPEVMALDPFHLPLSARPQRFTKLKGIPGAVRDASADAWGRRVI
jgi:serine/threonine-protein kinase HipA